jgi:hypothetical protein
MNDTWTNRLQITYADVWKLLQITDRDKVADNIRLREDGLYIDDPAGEVHTLDPHEHALLAEHPTGDFSRPALSFPVSLEKFAAFLEEYGPYGRVDWLQAAEWAAERGSSDMPSEKPRSESASTKDIHSLLKLVYGMSKVGYRYDGEQARNSATRDIVADLASAGVDLDDDTVLKWLRKAWAHCASRSRNPNSDKG